MKKALKWIFLVLGGLLILILAAAFVIPMIFKDDIKSAIDRELAKSVNADVVFDVDKFSLSLFSNFPNVTVEMRDLGVLNREPFAGEVLFATESFEVEVNLMDIVFGDELRLKGISLIRPVIYIKVLEDGRANYDIAVPSQDSVAADENGEFSFGIDHWQIVDGTLTYDDKSIPFFLELAGLNHSGSGDFTQDVFDLKTKTVSDSVNIGYGGDMYLSNKRIEIDAVVSIAEEYTKYTFKENSAKVNDFAMRFDGWFKMNDNDFGMDISFQSPDNTFKSLLSLVPGMYTTGFGNIETNGDLSFNGFVKGTYSEKLMPAFNLNLLVKDAMFKYPELPTPINNINVDLLVDNKDGIIDNTIVDLKKLHLDFGSNPVDARALITRIYPTNLDANVSARLNLAELGKMFPMEGLDMKGNYALNLSAKGIYDSVKHIIPAIDASMSLANGYVKSSEFPIPIQDLHFNSTIKSPSGKMEETIINVRDLSMMMDGEKFNADLILQNLKDYNWDLKAKGGIDLEKITKVFPVEGMTIAGKLKADIETKGKYSDLEAEKYDRLPTSGTASLTDFKYSSKDLPYDVTLSQAFMVFDPKKIDVQKLEGEIGKSDFKVDGVVVNYLGYVFGQNQAIKGNVNFSSNLLDLNEFMTDTEAAATDTASYGVVPVPANIDFVLKTKIKEIKLMDYTMTNASGNVIVKDGIANLSGLRFNMLGGTITVDGTYSTQDMTHPKYDFSLKMQDVSIREAATASSIIQSYAPIAALVTGNFSTDFSISGELLQSMMPNLATVNGNGLVKIVEAALKQSKLISGITSLANLDDADEVTLKDVLMSAAIKDGRLGVKPFDVKFGSYKTAVAGSTGLDGSLDYTLKMDVPAGKLGTEYNAFISKYTGGKNDPNANVPVTIGLGGKYDSPIPKLLMEGQKEQAKEAVTAAAKDEGQKALQKAVKGTDAEKIVGDILGTGKKTDSTAIADTTKTSTPAAGEDVQKQLEDEAKKKIQNLLKKKKN
ncbi:MAG: AsmA family protein [Cyclobacteriaceae bacterium]|nr:AsmA family protein [Cyclobacteriaceae bacterium]MDH4297318.1 AsmA family protein [Cyclobacteriaceae bacterium]MDH5250303.1 AsmA family protein [Cyclobacteriaceae bacterium]